MNVLTTPVDAPPRPDELSITPSPVRPTPLVVLPPVEPVAGRGLRRKRVALQQVDRALLLRVLTVAASGDCHIASEVSWWEASARAERASVERVRAERAAEAA